MLVKRERQAAFARLYLAMSLVSTLAPTVFGSTSDNAVNCPPTVHTPRQRALEARATTSDCDCEAFDRWRPAYHFQPKSNWINDPCGR